MITTQRINEAKVDKTQQRIAQLEESEDSLTKTLKMSQKEYEKHIQKLHDDLIKAWEGEERVKSLKIAIQVKGLFLSVDRVCSARNFWEIPQL